MISVSVKLFASIRDITGTGEIKISMPEDSPVSSILEELIHKYPSFAPWKDYVRLAVNYEYVQLSHILRDSDEVAVIPPVSGG
jgi:molybdopterin converting factor subunit 1